ncbi:MAG: MATE family efflux transporter [Hyphomonadaceae bacterium]
MTSPRLPAWARPKDMLDLTRLAVPVAISRASFMLMSLTDAVLLGRYAPGELPFVLNGWLPIGVLFGFGMGLMIGLQVLTAELNGAGKGDETGRIFRRGMAVALTYGLLATGVCIMIARPLLNLIGFDPALAEATAACTHILAYGSVAHMGGLACQSYLEALRKPNIATGINMAAVLFNMIAGLILVPEYGAIGVVWGTTASRWFMLVCFFLAVVLLTPAFRRAPKAPAGEFKRQNIVGIGTGIANIAEWGSFNLTFAMATLVSIDAGTVYGLTVQMMGVVFMIYVGMGTATSVRVAERFGQGNAVSVREASRLGVVASTLLGLILASTLILLRDPIAMTWLNGSEVASEGAHLVPQLSLMLAAVAFVTLFDGLQAVGSMALRAQGVVWIPTVIHVGSYVFVMLPLCWWLGLHSDYGVWGVVIGISVASLVAGVGQVLALEVKSARAVRFGLPCATGRAAAPNAH